MILIPYFELCADFLRLQFDKRLLGDFEVPAAENLNCQIPLRLENTKVSPQRPGHAAGTTTER